MRWIVGTPAVLGLIVGSLLVVLMTPATGGAASGREPVIVIPGLGGSEFVASSAFSLSVDNGHGGTFSRNYGAGEKVWVNTFQILLPGDDDYLDALKLRSDGMTTIAPAVQPSGIYWDAYGDLVNYLQRQGYVMGADLWLFPYDWRQEVELTARSLDTLITQALVAANGGQPDPAAWSIRRVDIVAHSLGGLVGRAYIADAARAARVDQLITLGSPQFGATRALKALVYGDQFGPWFGGIGLNPQEINDLSQNMAAGMQLLPSRAYDQLYDNSDSTRLRPWGEDRDIDGDGSVLGVLGYDQTNELLLRLRKNELLLGKARKFHDTLDGQAEGGGLNGVRWSALIGYGSGTLGQIREYTGLCLTWWWYQACPKRDEIPIDGDGTVAVLSATMSDPWRNNVLSTGAELSYVEREHSALVKRDGVGDGPGLEWIGATLAQSSQAAVPDAGAGLAFSGSEELTMASTPSVTRTPANRLSGTWIAALGPVALQISDANGRITGRSRGSASEIVAIPDTSYDQLPQAEFTFIKHDIAYTIDLIAEREGSVDVKVRVLGNRRVERTAVYLGVALGSSGHARLSVRPGTGRAASPAGWPGLEVDADGDGTFEGNVRAAAVLDAVNSADTQVPDVVIDSPSPVRTGSGTVTARWRAADHGAGLLLESAVIDPDTAPKIVTQGERLSLSSGQHRLLVVAVDRGGNARSQDVAFAVP
jgi:pimeloyl-ACP methyl ester carboxylesterase